MRWATGGGVRGETMIKRIQSLTLLLGCVAFATLSACGSGDADTPAEKGAPPEGATPGKWVTPLTPEDMPPPREGYTRLEAPVIEDVPPGGSVERCQYIRAPFETDLDVLDVGGYQTLGGHHSVVFASMIEEPVGTSRSCTDTDNQSVGAFLGGPNGDTGDSLPIPKGAGFRVRAGQTIMLNTHFINATENVIDGYTVIDIKFAEVDQSRTIATLFPIGGMEFEVPANSLGEFSGGCVVPERLELVGMSNHMHDWGASEITEVVRANGEVVVLREDSAWSYEMQFNAEWNFWDIEDPFIIEPGDTIRTHCAWENTTNQPLAYPREMCFGRAYILSGAEQFPVCFDGSFFRVGGSTAAR
jgi:hypothetical protein